MAWITLTTRKIDLQKNINSDEKRDTDLSRQLRGLERQASYEKATLQTEESRLLKNAKAEYDEFKKSKPYIDVQDDGKKYYDANGNEITKEEYDEQYSEWVVDYSNAKEEYELARKDTQDLYDQYLADIEEQVSYKQTQLQEEQAYVEVTLNSLNEELNTVSEQISTDIQNSAIKTGN